MKKILLFATLLATTFNVYAQIPVITSFSPAKGPVGTVVTITGNNFSAFPGNLAVYFGAVQGEVISADYKEIKVKVPGGASYQPLSVTNKVNKFTATANASFAVTFTNANPFGDRNNFGNFKQPDFEIPTGFYDRVQPLIKDFNGDGKPDILSLVDANKIALYQNNLGTNNPHTRTDIVLNHAVTGINIADINGDGKPDLLLTTSTNLLLLCLNVSAGAITSASFETAELIQLPGANDKNVYTDVADVDGDGKPDIIQSAKSGTNGHNYTAIYHNVSAVGTVLFTKSNVSFSQSVVYGVGDLDGDGKLDMIAGGIKSDGFGGWISYTMVYRNTSTPGNLAFAATKEYGLSDRGRIADINGDGKPDFVNTLYDGNQMQTNVFTNKSTPGNIDMGEPVNVGTGTLLDIGEINGDGKPDIFLYNRILYNNTQPGETITKESFFNPVFDYVPASTSLGDINMDGRADCIMKVRVNEGTTRLRVYLNKPVNNLPKITSFTPVSGPVGTMVTINGSGFDPVSSSNIVFFGDVKATVISATSTQLQVKVPGGASFAPVSVLNKGTGLVAQAQSGFSTTYYHPKPFSSYNNFGNFEKPDFSVPENYNRVEGKDLNDDGLPDIVAYAASGKGFTIFQNKLGSGNYAGRTNFATTFNIRAIDIADVNNDGRPDLVISNSGNQLVMYQNVLSGNDINSSSFVPVTLATLGNGGHILSTIITDVDVDGRPDIIINIGWQNGALSSCKIYRNISTTAAVQFEDAAAYSATISAAGDVNGDGKPEIIYQWAAPDWNHPSGNWVSYAMVKENISTPGTIAFKDGPEILPHSEAFIADLNSDNKNEVIFNSSNRVHVMNNQSTGLNISFSNRENIMGGGLIKIAELNGDGKPDFVIAGAKSSNSPAKLSGSIIAYNNYKQGLITSASFMIPVFNPFRLSSYGATTADIDADGRQDIIIAGATPANTGQLNIYRGNPFPVMPCISSISPLSGPVGTTVTIKGSGFSESVANNIVYLGAVKATVNSATATELSVTIPAGASYKPLSVVNTVTGLTGYSQAVFKTTFSAPAFAMQPKVDFAAGTGAQSFAAADVDGDGKVDMVVVNTTENTVSVYRNTATPGIINTSSFAARVNFATGSEPVGLAVEDINGDGKPEILVTNYGSNSFSIFRNTATPGVINASSFAARFDRALDTYTKPAFISVADINYDGRPDIAVATSDYLVVYKNYSKNGVINSAAFMPYTGWLGFSNSYLNPALTIADLNGDDRPEIMLTHSSTGNMSMLFNTGNAGIYPNQKIDELYLDEGYLFYAGPGASFMLNGDIDGDGKPDVLMTTKDNAYAVVMANTLQGQSNINFNRLYIPVGQGPVAAALGDLSGDGKPDIIVANSAANSITGYYNNTTPGNMNEGSFTNKTTYNAGAKPVAISIADIDGDGLNDIVVVNQDSKTISVIRNNSGSNPLVQAQRVQTSVSVSVYPNPTTSDIGFALDDYNGKSVNTQLTTLQGKTINVQTFTVNAKNSLIKLNLPQKPQPGIYMLTIIGDGLNESKKVIVQ